MKLPYYINFNNQFVVYDVWTLLDKDIPKITVAQLYLVLAFIKGEVKRNRFKKDKELIIVIDEAHLAIDKGDPLMIVHSYERYCLNINILDSEFKAFSLKSC